MHVFVNKIHYIIATCFRSKKVVCQTTPLTNLIKKAFIEAMKFQKLLDKKITNNCCKVPIYRYFNQKAQI